MDNKKKQFVINGLRRLSYRWYGRWQAEKRSKVGRNQYICENPDCGVIVGKKDTSMDHTFPVVDPEKGWQGFDEYIDRMFCSPELFKRLCNDCHDKKTQQENSIRKETKLKKKLDKKD